MIQIFRLVIQILNACRILLNTSYALIQKHLIRIQIYVFWILPMLFSIHYLLFIYKCEIQI